MKKILLVIRSEVVNIFTRPSYLILTFGLPVLGFILFLVFTNLNQKETQAISEIFKESPTTVQTEGFIDQGGIIKNVPEFLQDGSFQEFENENSAKKALEDTLISAYYLINPDIYDTGEIIYVRPDFNPLSGNGQDWKMRELFAYNLFDGDGQLSALVQYPVDFIDQPLDPSITEGQDSELAFIVPYVTTILFYIVILSSASLLLNSVVSEKQNRVIEVIMLSVSPHQLLTGKILGLGFVGLLQSLIYTSVGFTLLKISGRSVEVPPTLNFSPSILIWGIIFFVVGFLIYASLMAGLGALVPNIREASQATFVVIAPMIVPMLFISIMLEQPHGPIATFLSLFPLTAPVAMMTRLASGGVPLWHPILAVILSLLTAALILRTVTGVFRSQTLLSGQEFKISLFFKAMIGKI
ncbi:MAG: ABC transporter permease [Chloroflexi bacterium]|nr:ABC transporter permease [Chloroflexota bacterium]